MSVGNNPADTQSASTFHISHGNSPGEVTQQNTQLSEIIMNRLEYNHRKNHLDTRYNHRKSHLDARYNHRKNHLDARYKFRKLKARRNPTLGVQSSKRPHKINKNMGRKCEKTFGYTTD
ncbi:8932_t:CDS:1 [Diversispora eburnea]|uniref:8932_t:CDS:1 n=1 Tax=Diversispora eburnea TaxID=1213867 RepID=A0A9N9D8Z0_9GLOM|nr:8932_t:CDS:1 [Diversispora eburnea]